MGTDSVGLLLLGGLCLTVFIEGYYVVSDTAGAIWGASWNRCSLLAMFRRGCLRKSSSRSMPRYCSTSLS